MMQQQQPPPPPPPQHPPPQAVGGGGGGGEFYRGPPQPPMRLLSAASSTNLSDYAAHQAPPPSQQHQPPYEAYGDSFGAKRMRKPVQRRTVDYTSTIVRYVQARLWQRDARDRVTLQPTPAAVLDMLPSVAYPDNPSTSFAAKLVHSSINKNRCSINRVLVSSVIHMSSLSLIIPAAVFYPYICQRTSPWLPNNNAELTIFFKGAELTIDAILTSKQYVI